MQQSLENKLAKYFSGEATPEELEFVNQWKEHHLQLFESYRNAYQADFFDKKNFSPNQWRLFSKSRAISHWVILKAVALFAGLLAMTFALYFYSQTLHVRYVNTTASVQHIVLPDGSNIFLDKHAKLSYQKSFFGHFDRNVRMTGRIFFHVFHDPAHPFHVFVGTIKIEVLGTQFTVNQLRNKTQVILTHGRVRVSTPNKGQQALLQKRGDQVIVIKNAIRKQNRVNAALYASWLDKKIYFRNCTVKDIVDMLNDSYNIKLQIQAPNDLSKMLYGSAPSDNPRLIVAALSQIIHMQIKIR